MIKYFKEFENIDYLTSTPFHHKNQLWFGAPFSQRDFELFLSYVKNLNINNFVELGIGDLSKSIMASKYFKNVYSLEIYRPYWIEARKKIKEQNITNIHLILGDILKDLNKIPQEKSIVYSFLPFFDEERNTKMWKLCAEYFPAGSYFYFVGIDRFFDKANIPNLELVQISANNTWERTHLYVKTYSL